jgi:hypothetical protein
MFRTRMFVKFVRENLHFLVSLRPGFESRHCQKKVVYLEQSPFSLVSTAEELLDRKVAAPVYKTKNTAVGIRHADHVAPSIRKKLAIASPTSCCRSVGIVRSRTQIMEFLGFNRLGKNLSMTKQVLNVWITKLRNYLQGPFTKHVKNKHVCKRKLMRYLFRK